MLYMDVLNDHVTCLDHLDSTINNVYDVVLGVSIPVNASLRHDLRNLEVIDVIGPLQQGHEKSLSQMESNMTVESPGAWVVCIELDHHVLKGTHILNISTLGILRVHDGFPIPLTSSNIQNPHIVAMKMHRLWYVSFKDMSKPGTDLTYVRACAVIINIKSYA